MAFEAVCDRLGIDAKETYKSVNGTIWTYKKYLIGYAKALEKKSTTFNVVAARGTEIKIGNPTARIWKVVPRNVIKINDSNRDWYACPDLSDSVRDGDSVNVFKGREGVREIDPSNHRVIKGQHQFRFPELGETRSIVVWGEGYAVEPAFEELSDNVEVTISGRKVKCRKSSDSSLEVFGILDGNLRVNGKNVDYAVVQNADIPPLPKRFGEGHLVVSDEKPYSGIANDVTDEILGNLTESDYLLGDKTLKDLGFEKDGPNSFASFENPKINESVIVPRDYPGMRVPIAVAPSKGVWYCVKMPLQFDRESSSDPRMVLFEDNAIIRCGDRKLEIKDKNIDDMEVEFYLYGDKDRKSVDLGKHAQIDVKFNTRDVWNQIHTLDGLENNAPLELTSLINIFRKTDSKGNWGRFSIDGPKYGWRVLTNDSFSGVVQQRNFVRKALSTPDFAVLDGPPGTGKTTAIRELIIQLILDGKRVLVASSTNAAIDNVLDRIINIDCKKQENKDFETKLRPIRLGMEDKASDDVKSYSMENMLRENASRNVDDSLLKKIMIDSSNLVCGTIGKVYSDLIHIPPEEGGWKYNLSTLPEFDYLIMDESSKTTFQEFIVPAKLAKRWILAGDVRQLSPFTDRGSVETALDLFSGPESRLEVSDITKTAVALINEAKRIIHNPRRKYAVIVADAVAKEIESQLGMMDSGITNGQFSVYCESFSYTDLYSARVIYVGKTLFSKRRSVVPVDCCIVNLAGEFNIAPELFHYSYIANESEEDHFKNWKQVDEDSVNLGKSWAEGIAWRLERDYWLRNQKDNKKNYIQEIKDRIPGEFDDNEKKKTFMNQCIWTVQNVVFHSILELLTVDNGKYDYQSLVKSFEPDELKLRSESLVYQHRMHEEISKTPSELFYNGELHNGPLVNQTDIGYFPVGYHGHHNIWIDCKGKDQGNINNSEIEIIEKQMNDLLNWAENNPKKDGSEYSVILLTFYLAQSNKMKEKFDSFRKKADGILNVKIATVDYIQGQEADFVFLSMVRQKNTGFLDTPNRLNVAITRAKHLLVIIGNLEFFRTNKQSNELRRITEGCYVH